MWRPFAGMTFTGIISANSKHQKTKCVLNLIIKNLKVKQDFFFK